MHTILEIRSKAIHPFIWYSMILAVEVILVSLGLAGAGLAFIVISILHSAIALFGNGSSNTGGRPAADSGEDFLLPHAA